MISQRAVPTSWRCTPTTSAPAPTLRSIRRAISASGSSITPSTGRTARSNGPTTRGRTCSPVPDVPAAHRGRREMQQSVIRHAVAAVTGIISELGLTVDDATVLHNSNKLALRLLPCNVFARIAHVGQEVAELEIELALRFAEIGSPVAALDPRVVTSHRHLTTQIGSFSSTRCKAGSPQRLVGCRWPKAHPHSQKVATRINFGVGRGFVGRGCSCSPGSCHRRS